MQKIDNHKVRRDGGVKHSERKISVFPHSDRPNALPLQVLFCRRFFETSVPTAQKSFPTAQKSFPTTRESLGTTRESLATGRESLRTGRESLRTGRESLRTGRESLGTGRESLGTGRESLGTGRESFSAASLRTPEKLDNHKVRRDGGVKHSERKLSAFSPRPPPECFTPTSPFLQEIYLGLTSSPNRVIIQLIN